MEPSNEPNKEFLNEGIQFFKQMWLENQSHITAGLSKGLDETNKRLESLERSLIGAAEASLKVAKALNWLIGMGGHCHHACMARMAVSSAIVLHLSYRLPISSEP